ncbi:MAG TPA: hopanoid biosynthesis-associated protein HpnK [Steroidobacteraceae bacterium]|nr:hopanoid biosynthesis-associated protein HpnK [Steroidobacteraceae bacterium]
MHNYLIVTADDFGLHESVNEAVEQASRAGILNAASLMVTAHATKDAIRRARMLPNLGVGLHVVLADGWSTLDAHLIPEIADPTGRMHSDMFRKGVRFFFKSGARRQLEAEIRAQFAAFARTGLTLDHVNVHKHFHIHPTILNILLEVGRDYGMPAMRVPHEPFWFAARSAGVLPGLAQASLSPWIALMKHRLRRARIFHNDRIFGMAGSGAMDEAGLLAILARLPPGVSEIYLHPATESGSAIAASMSQYRHAEELDALSSLRVRAALNAVAVRGGYAEVMRAVGRSLA